MHFHWQNLNEDRNGKPKGWPWHGRAWLAIGAIAFRWSWLFWGHHAGAHLDFEPMERHVTFFVGLPPLNFWVGWECRKPEWFWRRLGHAGRSTGLRFFDSAVWWSCWENQHCSSGRDPWWQRGNWHPLDTLFGRTKYAARELSRHDVAIPMPEGAYPASVLLEECTWKRPRLPFASSRGIYADVKVKPGIPFEGKGENSWDCGTDALYGLSAKSETVEEAIAKTVQAVLRNRRRYDGNVMAKHPAPKVETHQEAT